MFLFTSPRSASDQTSPTADYRFQNTLSSSVGTAPALTKIGSSRHTFTTATVDGTSHKVLRFPKGNGLKLSPATSVVSSSTYTIVVLFELDSVSGFRRLIDFKNGTSDSGLYVHDGNLRFYPHLADATPTPIAANTYVQVVLSRDSGGMVRAYVDGVSEFSFTDSSNDAVIDSNNTLRFFRDNESVGSTTEHSAGSVARIRLYNSALTPGEIGRLDRIEPTIFTVNSMGDVNDLDFPGGVFDQSADGKCDVSTTAGIQCTLRAAINQASVTSGHDTINFASGLSGTIPLSLGRLYIGNDATTGSQLTINGPGARALTVSANNASRVFEIASGANVAINGLTISGGNTSGSGGGIHMIPNSTLTLNNSTVSGNIANNSFGGGIYNSGGTLTLNNSTVSGNQATGNASTSGGVGGGISNNTGGQLTMTNSTVSGNTGTFNTGGIHNGFNNDGSRMTLTNTTVTNNSPGGISNASIAILSNTIVAGNNPSTFPDVQGVFTSQGNNLIGQNPLLGPLQNNGGPTNTHALLRGSPALNTIPYATNGCGTDIRTDQRGLKRPQGKQCDTGSYEKKIKKRRR